MSKFAYLSGFKIAEDPTVIKPPVMMTVREVWQVSRSAQFSGLQAHMLFGGRSLSPRLTFNGKVLGLTFDSHWQEPFDLSYALNEIMIEPATQTILSMEVRDSEAMHIPKHYGVFETSIERLNMRAAQVLNLHLAPMVPSRSQARV